MPGNAARVKLTEGQRKVLHDLIASEEKSAIRQRATIVLTASAGRLNEDIAQVLGLQRRQVGLWRRRWQEASPELLTVEKVEPQRLCEMIRDILRDAPRSGRPPAVAAAKSRPVTAADARLAPQRSCGLRSAVRHSPMRPIKLRTTYLRPLLDPRRCMRTPVK